MPFSVAADQESNVRVRSRARTADIDTPSPSDFVARVLHQQQTIGNAAVARMISRRTGSSHSIQRCGDTPCGCSPAERAAKEEDPAATLAQRSLVQRSEEGSEGSESGEGGYAGGLACSLLPDSVVIAGVRAYFGVLYPRALAHLDYYLAGSGGELTEDVGNLIVTNPRIAARIGQLIQQDGGRSGTLTGRGVDDGGTPPIRQSDFDDQDWRLSIGNVDQVTYELLGDPDGNGNARVRLGLRDPYEWHPAEGRDTQCIHQAMENQKAKGARDYISVGSSDVILRVGAPATP